MSAHPFVVVTDDQRTDAWKQARVGFMTGSEAAAMLSTRRDGKESAERRNLRTRIVIERVTGQPPDDGFVAARMRRGSELEQDACAAYELATDRVVRPCGFLRHTELLAGCSPDGQVENFAGIVEIKAPDASTHLGYLRSESVPDDYLPQITHNLWITGAPWCDFISYDPRWPEPLRLVIRRVLRDEAAVASYELLVRQFLREIDTEAAEVLRLAMRAVA